MIDEYEGSSVGGPSQAEAAAQSASHAGSLPDYPVAMGESAEEEDEVGDEDDADSDDDSLDLENLPATVENCLALNQAYQEVLDQIIEKLDSTVATNREQQQHLQEQLDHCSGDPDVRVVTKVPVQMYLPPYFKDTANMYPPPNADTIRKAHSGEFDPLVEVPKRWSVSEKEKLLNGVRQSLMEIRLKPLENRKDIVKEKLASDTRQSEEKKELRVNSLYGC